MRGKYFTIALVSAFLIGVGVGALWPRPSQTKPLMMRTTVAIPTWKPPRCEPANASEREFFETAVSALERVDPHAANWLTIGAERALSEDFYRRIPGNVANQRVCAPEGIYERVSAALAGKPFKGRFSRYQVDLASHMRPPPSEVVDAVARIAFSPYPVMDDTSEEDFRPTARTVLAGFGPQASKYVTSAFEQISDESPLGTGAAQVAAAGGHPEALLRIESLMNQLLASVPAERAIPLAVRDRLYELAWAIYFSGNLAKNHTAPLVALMGRRVESLAPPFGMIVARPKRMCEVLLGIYGGEISATKSFRYCDDAYPLESSPLGAFAPLSPNNVSRQGL